jgi:hypothetical protein
MIKGRCQKSTIILVVFSVLIVLVGLAFRHKLMWFSYNKQQSQDQLEVSKSEETNFSKQTSLSKLLSKKESLSEKSNPKEESLLKNLLSHFSRQDGDRLDPDRDTLTHNLPPTPAISPTLIPEQEELIKDVLDKTKKDFKTKEKAKQDLAELCPIRREKFNITKFNSSKLAFEVEFQKKDDASADAFLNWWKSSKYAIIPPQYFYFVEANN